MMQGVPRKGVLTAFCDTIYTIYLSVCTQTADPNSFRGTHCICLGVCTNNTAPSVSSINRILRNRAAERAAAEYAHATQVRILHMSPQPMHEYLICARTQNTGSFTTKYAHANQIRIVLLSIYLSIYLFI